MKLKGQWQQSEETTVIASSWILLWNVSHFTSSNYLFLPSPKLKSHLLFEIYSSFH